MDKDQITGKAEQLAGKLKQGIGETFGNQKLANEGVVDQVKGAAKETWGNAKDAAHATTDHQQREADLNADGTRSGIRARIDEATESINEKIDAHKLSEREKDRTL